MALQHPNMTVAHRKLTAKERQILEKPVFVHVGIVLPDGTPHVSAMWVDLDGEDIILNTAEGRTKAKVLRVGSPVGLSALDPENPYRNVNMRGRVVQVIAEEEGAGAGINRLAKKYLGVEEYQFRAPGERRVQFRVRAEVISGRGKD
jgi:PPOX class probable F420-dependent enzyme